MMLISDTLMGCVMNCSLGPARLSEFTFKTAFGREMHGYRATIIGRDKGV